MKNKKEIFTNIYLHMYNNSFPCCKKLSGIKLQFFSLDSILKNRSKIPHTHKLLEFIFKDKEYDPENSVFIYLIIGGYDGFK